MSLGDLLFGKPLASYEESEQRLGPVAGIGDQPETLRFQEILGIVDAPELEIA